MAKKMFLPARLSKKVDRWEIVYYQTDPATGLRKRFRETRDLNRIHDIKLREKEADREIKAINKALPTGYPFKTESISGQTVFQAISLAVKIKVKNSTKPRSHVTYRSLLSVFGDFCEKMGLMSLDVKEFSKQHARRYVFWMRHDRQWKRGQKTFVGLSNKKTNHYQSMLSGCFNELVEEGIVEHNPMLKMKRLKPEPTKRRAYEEDERISIFSRMWDHDRPLFYASLLQFHCLIRGEALRDLRFSMFDLVKGVIVLPESIEKNSEKAVKTIPSSILHYFTNADFIKYPANWLVFGQGMRPHPTKRIGPNMLNTRFKKILAELEGVGAIGNTVDVSFYSNKNAGITEMLKTMPLLDVMDQAAHKDPKTTMLYRQKPEFNPNLRAFKAQIFEHQMG